MPGATTTPSEPLLRRAPWRMGSCRSKLCSGFGIGMSQEQCFSGGMRSKF